ncbi:hypothetical protein niasHT_005784 [Heterodera trifolii]|uniref:Uncharacterized protein n=1 Tax=Heterodera trifolii TaxID=157864 RepID=A0ABD2LWD2_9BILA
MKSAQRQQQTMSKSQPQKQLQKQQIVRRQISQAKGPEAMKRETETLQRKAAPSVGAWSDETCRLASRVEQVPLLSKTFTALNMSSSTDFRQRCRDGTLRSPTPIFRQPRHRSNSIDSDLSDVGPPDDVFGILARRNRTKSRERNKWNFSWRAPKSSVSNTASLSSDGTFSCGAASSMGMTTTKLPQLDGFCPGRTSCQLQHVSRSHFELIKYKRTLNS